MGQRNSYNVHDINWGVFNHASHAPQLMSCNDYVYVIILSYMQNTQYTYVILLVSGILGLSDTCTYSIQEQSQGQDLTSESICQANTHVHATSNMEMYVIVARLNWGA